MAEVPVNPSGISVLNPILPFYERVSSSWGYRSSVITNSTGPYTISESDDSDTFILDPSGGAFSVTLPNPSSVLGRSYRLVKKNANSNMMANGDCESATQPLTSGSGTSLVNCTFARSTDYAYQGTYSYKFLRTTTGIAQARIAYHTASLGPFVTSGYYKLRLRMYVPSAGINTLSNISVDVQQYVGSFSVTHTSSPIKTDAWQTIELPFVVNASATQILIELAVASADSVTAAIFYVDDIALYKENTITIGSSILGTIAGADNAYLDSDNDEIVLTAVDSDRYAIDLYNNFGINSNGNWVRYADGTMICRYVDTNLRTLSTTRGTLTVDSSERTYTFPQTFSAAPQVSPAPLGNSEAVIWETFTTPPTTSQCSMRLATSNSGIHGYDGYIATGRWRT